MTEAVIIAGVVLVVTAVVGAGLVLVRRTVSQQLLARHTDVVGYVYQGVGVIYGVILAFVVIAAWEEYGDAQTATVDEATAVLNLARMANGWPARDRAGMEEALTAYARQVVAVEWPAMARGEFGPAIGTATINSIWQALNEADEAAARESASYAAAVAELNVLGDARGQRVLLAQEGLPLSMRMVLAIGAVVIVAFMYLLAVDDGRLHAVMTVSLAGLVALLLLLNYQLQRPFHGVVAIPATAMELVLNELEAEAGLPGMTSAGQPQ